MCIFASNMGIYWYPRPSAYCNGIQFNNNENSGQMTPYLSNWLEADYLGGSGAKRKRATRRPQRPSSRIANGTNVDERTPIHDVWWPLAYDAVLGEGTRDSRANGTCRGRPGQAGRIRVLASQIHRAAAPGSSSTRRIVWGIACPRHAARMTTEIFGRVSTGESRLDEIRPSAASFSFFISPNQRARAPVQQRVTMLPKSPPVMSLLLLVLLVLVAVDSIGYADPYVHTLAGSGQVGSADGIGALASFDTPFGVAVDWATNNVIVADCDNNAIRRVTQSGVVSTLNLTSTLTLDGPTDLVFDSHGNLFVSLIRRHIIVKIASNLAVTAWAGNGTSGTMNGDGTSAMFRNPAGLAIDAHDNLYVADSGNNLVRKVTPTGTVSTVAGGFSRPWGVAIAPSGTIYVSDTSNFQIKQVDTAGKVSVLAGSGTVGSQEGVGPAATFDYPYGIRLDTNGNLFVAEYGSNRIRKVTTPLGNVTTYAGGIGGYADGPSLTAKFLHPAGLAFGPDGAMYVADEVGERVRVIGTRPRSTAKATTTGGRRPAPTPAPSTSFLATNRTYYCSQQGATSQNVPIGLGGSASIASHPTGRFASGLDCTFVITASAGHVVKLVFSYLYLDDGDFLVVYDGKGTSSILQASTSTTAISTGRTMTVVFTSANANFGWAAHVYDVLVPTTNTLPTCSGGERPDHQCGPSFGNSGCAPGRCCSSFGWCGAYFQPLYCSTSTFACALPYNDTVRASLVKHTLGSGPTTPPYVYCGLASQASLVAPNDNTWVYSAGMDCAVTITATPGRVVKFTTTEASLYGSDAVTIFDGNTTTSNVIAVLVGNALALSGTITSTGRSMTIAFSIQQASSWWAVSVADVAPVVGLVYCMRASGQTLALTTPGQQATVRATGQNCTMTITTNVGQSVAVTPMSTYYDPRVRLLAYDVGSSAPLSWAGRPFVSSGNTLTIAFVAAGPGLYTTGAVSVTTTVRPTAFCTGGVQELDIAGVGQNVTISSAYVPADCTFTVKATAGRAVRVVFSSVSLQGMDTLTVTDGYQAKAGSYAAFTSYGPSVTITSLIAGSYSTWQATVFDVPRPPMPTFCTGAEHLAMTAPGQNATIASTSTPNCTLVVTATPGRAVRLLFSSVDVWQSGDYLTVNDGYHTYSAAATYWIYPPFTSYGRSLTISSRTLGSSSSWTIVAFDVPRPPVPTFCTGNQQVAIEGPGQNVTIASTSTPNCTLVVAATPGRALRLVFSSVDLWHSGDYLTVNDGYHTYSTAATYWIYPSFTSYGRSLTISSRTLGSLSSWTIVAFDVPRPRMPTFCSGNQQVAIEGPGQNVTITAAYMATNCTLVVTATPGRALHLLFSSVNVWQSGDYLTVNDGYHTYGAAATYWNYPSFTSYGRSLTISSRTLGSSSSWTIVAFDVPLPPMPTFCTGNQQVAIEGPGQNVTIASTSTPNCTLVVTATPGRALRLLFSSVDVWQSGDYLAVNDGYHTYSAAATYWNYPSFTSYGRSLTISSRILGSSSSWTIVAFDVPRPPMPTFCTGNQQVAIEGSGHNVTIVSTSTPNCTLVVTATPGRALRLLFSSVNVWHSGDYLAVNDGYHRYSAAATYWDYPPFTSYGRSLTISSRTLGSSSWTIVAIDVPRPPMPTFCTGNQHVAIAGPGQNVTISVPYMATNCTMVVSATPGRSVKLVFASISMYEMGDTLNVDDGFRTHNPLQSWDPTFTSYGGSWTISSLVAGSHSSWTVVAIDVPRPTFCTGVMHLNLPCSGPPVPISSLTLANCTLVITAAPQCTVRLAFTSYSMWGRDSAVATIGASTYRPWTGNVLTGQSVTITSTFQRAYSYWTADASTAPLPKTVIQTTTYAFCQGDHQTAVSPGLGRQLEIWGGNVNCSITVTSSSPGSSVQLTFRSTAPSISVYDAMTNAEVAVAIGVPIVSTGRSLTIVFANAKQQMAWWLAIVTDYQAPQTLRLVRRAVATSRPSGGFARGVVGYLLRVRFTMTLLASESLDAAKDRFQIGESAALGIGKDRIIIETATVNAPSNTVTLVISFKSSTPADQAAVLATLEDPNNPGVATFDASTVQTMYVCQDGQQVTSSDQCNTAALEPVRAAARAMTSPSHSTVAVVLFVTILTLQF